MAQRVAQQLVALAQTVVLARMLAPQDFGLMGIALLAVRFGEVFTYTGYEYALIQKTDLGEADLHTAWVIMLGRRLILAAGLFLLAAPMGLVLHEPGAVPLLRVLSLVQVVTGLSSLGPVLLHRELAFARCVACSLPGSVVGLVVSIGLALAWRNAWALAGAHVAQAATACALSYSLHPYRPRLRIDGAALRQLSGYGQWMLASAVLNLVVTQGSDTACGWMFGPGALGLYQMASKLALQPATQIGEVIASAALPSYAKIQEESSRLTSAFLRVLGLTAFSVLPLSALIVGLGPLLVGTVLGAKWLQCAALFPVLAVAGLLRALLRTGTSLFLATGRPKLQFLMDGAGAVIMCALLYPLGRAFGPWGLGLVSVLGAAGALAVWWWGVRRELECSIHDLAKALLPSLCGAVSMLTVLVVSSSLAQVVTGVVAGLVLSVLRVAMAGIAYLVILYVCTHLLGTANTAIDAFALARSATPGLSKWARRRTERQGGMP